MTDQGMGDVISFARFLPAVIERSAFVHIRVHPELVKLLVESTRATLASGTDTKARDAARKELANIERKITRQMELAGEMTTPAPALRRVRGDR